ncbi:MAG: hypothetical protein ACFB51_21985 [Anaerolineae bacterium]
MATFNLPRKMTIRAHGQRVVLVHSRRDRPEHTLMKALLWALYLPDYPDAKIELRIGDRYKPDVVELDDYGEPVFWAEAGKVGRDKIHSVARRFRDTHIAIAKWDARLTPIEAIVSEAVEGLDRTAPFDLIRFPPDSYDRFMGDRAEISVDHTGLEWLRIGAFS